MKKYAFIPSGSSVWVDVARGLHDSGAATPVLWLGDPGTNRAAQDAFPDCRIVPSARIATGEFAPTETYSGGFSDFWTSANYLRAKRRGALFFDRTDAFGTRRGVTKTLAIDALCAWALAAIEQQDPEFLLMSEPPHTAPSYVLHEIFRHLGREILSFTEFGGLPGMGLRKGGPEGALVALPKDAQSPLLADILRDEIPRWAKQASAASSEAEAIAYVRQQSASAARKRRMQRFWSMVKAPVRLPLTPLTTAISNRFSVDLAPRDKTRNLFRQDMVRLRAAGDAHATIKERLFKLHSALADEAEAPLPKRFVYMPLGPAASHRDIAECGDHHDPFDCLIALRRLLPDDVSICVREHPDQLLPARRGFTGRSPGFYRMIKSIQGVQVLPPETSGRDPIGKCLFVATADGPSALQAALQGTSALTFGRHWFDGCPNTDAFGVKTDFEALTTAANAGPDDIVAWLKSHAQAHCLPSFVTRDRASGQKPTQVRPGLNEAAVDATVAALKSVLKDD